MTHCKACNQEVATEKKRRFLAITTFLVLGIAIPMWPITLPYFQGLALILWISAIPVCAICKSEILDPSKVGKAGIYTKSTAFYFFAAAILQIGLIGFMVYGFYFFDLNQPMLGKMAGATILAGIGSAVLMTLCLLTAVIYFIIGAGLLRHYQWARKLAVFFALIMPTTNLLTIPLALAILFFLWSPTTRLAFEKQSLAVGQV